VTLALRPLAADEIPAVAAQIERDYAADIEQHGGIPREKARRKAKEDIPAVLADPGSALYALEDDGRRVGHLWLGEREVQTGRVLWIWDVFVDVRHRGRGFGKEAMGLVEEEARRRGLTRIELNVFGGNEVARNLYRSVGYSESAVMMAKEVE
jgi:ribosomal protein S18 acetylase RimI-like enzyme